MTRLVRHFCVLMAVAFHVITTPGASTADLDVDVTATPDPAAAGTPLNYTVTLRNLGKQPATGVVVTNTLDLGVAFQSAVVSTGSYSENGRFVKFVVGQLAAGASATIEIRAVPGSSGLIIFSATARGLEAEEVTYNNSITIQTSVTGPVNMRPVVHLQSPETGAVLVACEDIIISGNATDEDDEIATIELFIDGKRIGASTDSQFEFRWPRAAAGTFTLGMIVTDTRQGVTALERQVQVAAVHGENFVEPEIQDGAFACCFAGDPGLSYSIEASEDFNAWTEVHRIEPGAITGGFVDANLSGTVKVYRAVRESGN